MNKLPTLVIKNDFFLTKNNKVKPLVLNQSWDTRIAASQTIESIVKNLNFLELALFSGLSIFNLNLNF